MGRRYYGQAFVGFYSPGMMGAANTSPGFTQPLGTDIPFPTRPAGAKWCEIRCTLQSGNQLVLTVKENGVVKAAFGGSSPGNIVGQQLPELRTDNADLSSWTVAAEFTGAPGMNDKAAFLFTWFGE